MNINKKYIINDFKVTHNVPNLTEEEREAVKKDILKKIYNLFTIKENYIYTKVK